MLVQLTEHFANDAASYHGANDAPRLALGKEGYIHISDSCAMMQVVIKKPWLRVLAVCVCQFQWQFITQVCLCNGFSAFTAVGVTVCHFDFFRLVCSSFKDPQYCGTTHFHANCPNNMTSTTSLSLSTTILVYVRFGGNMRKCGSAKKWCSIKITRSIQFINPRS